MHSCAGVWAASFIESFSPSLQRRHLEDEINFFFRHNEAIPSSFDISLDSTLVFEVVRWIRSRLPVHRCSVEGFMGILALGCVLSRSHLVHRLNADFITQCVVCREISHLLSPDSPFVRSLASSSLVSSPRDLLTSLRTMFSEHLDGPQSDQPIPRSSPFSYLSPLLQEGSQDFDLSSCRLPSTLHSTLLPISDLVSSIKTDVDRIQTLLETNQLGVNCSVDQSLGLDQHVFSVLGYNPDELYGSIAIVFQREVLLHDDCFVTCGSPFAYWNAFTWPGMVVPCWRLSGIDELEEGAPELIEQIHKSAQTMKDDAGVEILAREVILKCQRLAPLENLSLTRIQEIVQSSDHHNWLHAHLPGVIPLRLAKWIVVDRESHARIREVQYSLRYVFGEDWKRVYRVVDDVNQELERLGAIESEAAAATCAID